MSIDRWVLLCLVCLTTFFVDNSVLVPDIMESGNIVTAREMVYDGNWIAPTMNGELRLEKPPLPTWLTAVVEMIAPDNLGWQRGVAGLAALLLVFYFYCFVIICNQILYLMNFSYVFIDISQFSLIFIFYKYYLFLVETYI